MSVFPLIILTMSKPTLYQFEGSVWVKAPLIAIIEGGNALDDFEIKRVNLAEVC